MIFYDHDCEILINIVKNQETNHITWHKTMFFSCSPARRLFFELLLSPQDDMYSLDVEKQEFGLLEAVQLSLLGGCLLSNSSTTILRCTWNVTKITKVYFYYVLLPYLFHLVVTHKFLNRIKLIRSSNPVYSLYIYIYDIYIHTCVYI